MSDIDDTITGMAAGLAAFEFIEQALGEEYEAATLMLATSTLLTATANMVAEICDKHPRDVVARICEGTMRDFPEKPAPKVEDMKTVVGVKKGKSPWAL